MVLFFKALVHVMHCVAKFSEINFTSNFKLYQKFFFIGWEISKNWHPPYMHEIPNLEALILQVLHLILEKISIEKCPTIFKHLKLRSERILYACKTAPTDCPEEGYQLQGCT
jgi:hypothetical protein